MTVSWPVSMDVAPSKLLAYLRPKVIQGTTDIDDSVQTESTAWQVIEIAPQANCPLVNVTILLDLAKATTGIAAVETSVTFQYALARKIDGTNWRREAYVEAALSGTNSTNRAQRLNAGVVSVESGLRVYLLASGDVTSDMEIPFEIQYMGELEPTVTLVAA